MFGSDDEEKEEEIRLLIQEKKYVLLLIMCLGAHSQVHILAKVAKLAKLPPNLLFSLYKKITLLLALLIF